MTTESFPNKLLKLFTNQDTGKEDSLLVPSDFKFGKPLSTKEVEDFEKGNRIIFPIALKELFFECNGIRINWHAEASRPEKVQDIENSDFNGSIRLLSMEQIWGGWKGNGWVGISGLKMLIMKKMN